MPSQRAIELDQPVCCVDEKVSDFSDDISDSHEHEEIGVFERPVLSSRG